jgi:catechol 2,3-dioxygenase-like lactoylglutathione lyase family enzyme
MFDHVDLNVSDLEASKRFYATVLAPLGLALTWEGDGSAEFGALSLTQRKPVTEHLHLAFLARTPDEVDAFHRAGIEAGYRDNGTPGLREYAPDYYASYLLDPDSHNVEAVYREPATRNAWSWLRWEP